MINLHVASSDIQEIRSEADPGSEVILEVRSYVKVGVMIEMKLLDEKFCELPTCGFGECAVLHCGIFGIDVSWSNRRYHVEIMIINRGRLKGLISLILIISY